MTALKRLVAEVERCTRCAEHLPLGPRPVLRISATAPILIIGLAPGTKVHESGIPWNDRSGDRLREWLAVDRDTFYDTRRIAIMPMGFCYPGRDKNGGDAPPRPECAPAWHAKLMRMMPKLDLILLVGSYAQAHYLADRRKKTMSDTVTAWADYAPRFVPLPHPSWRNTAWLKKNPWFARELLPVLRKRTHALLAR
jgi:uracil-DNA glycosylase